MQQVATSDTLPPSADVDVQLCDTEGCDAVAVFSYRWEWGATGNSCAHHATLLQQTAESLKRTIAVHPIPRSSPLPLLRDERTQLIAKHLVLEAELAEAKNRGLEVYRKNGDLQVQLNTAIVKERELRAQLQDSGEKRRVAEQRASEVNAENGRLLVELERLRALETFVAEREDRERRDRGLDTNVVDG
jgi:hypothetical protein